MNTTMEAVTFRNVSEKYRIKFIIEGKESWEDFWALKAVSFSVDKGQTLAIIGENGAGKSTILKLIAGLLKADKGEVLVKGKVSALLELGAGFHPEFTGRENLYLNASLFGLTKNDTDSIFNKIVEFSGLGKFIDAQVKSYSQGMFVRLAFSVAIHVNPDILLIDDSLSVGDEDFQKKCIQKIVELKNEGKTIIFVTHDLNMARRLCAKGIFLRTGEIIKDGSIDAVISYYMETLGDRKGIAIIQKDPLGVVFNNGRLIMRWTDKTITQDQGGYSSFSFCGHRFNSPTANWQVEKKDKNRIVAKGEWFNIPVTQIWDIRLLDDSRLKLNVALEIHDKYSVENFQVELLFRAEYSHWFSLERKGVFPGNFFHERECELIYDSIDEFAGLKGGDKEEGGESFPIVVADAFEQKTEALCQIFNSGLDVTARIIRFKLPGVYEAIENAADTCPSLDLKIKLIGSNRQDMSEEGIYGVQKLIKEEKQKFGKKKMELCANKFTFGRGRFSLRIDGNNFLQMYYDEEKLTCGRGIITGLRISNECKDTYANQMRIRKIAENHIQVCNIALIDVPVIQTWSFLMREEGVIEVAMAMDAQSQISIHEIQVGVFFSQVYTQWFTPYESGDFNDDFKVWEQIPLKNKNIKAIGLVAASLPTIVFDFSPDLKYLPRICHSDGIFPSPVVQAVAEGMEYRKGKSEFFRGVIRISEDKNSIYEEQHRFAGLEQETEESVFDQEELGDSPLYLVDGQDMSVEMPQNRLAQMRQMHDKGKLGIAVSRFNFFKLENIIKFYADLFNGKADLGDSAFKPFPVRTIFSNSMGYFKQIKAAAEKIGMRLVLKDKDLPEILRTVSLQATAYNGKQLLRLLGVICEHPFVGPRQIIIDLYHRCNASCVHCWFHNPKTTFSKEYLDMQLDFDFYKKIVDDAQQLSVALIVFDGNGEPLLDKRFPEMARYAKDKGIMVSFSTNGSLFSEDMAKKTLFDLDVETITCSLPAATEETYRLINPKHPGAFHEIVDNMSYFIKLRNSTGIKKPCLQMNHLVHSLNCHELMQMAQLDAKIGADIVQFCIIQKLDKNIIHLALSKQQIEMIRDGLEGIAIFLRKKNIALDDSFLFQLKSYGENAGTESKTVCNNSGCPIGWFQTLISANSEVSMCKLKVIDSLTGKSLKEIWNSEKYHRYRIQAKYLKNNKEVTFMNGTKLYDEDCQDCNILRAILKTDNFLTYNLDKFV